MPIAQPGWRPLAALLLGMAFLLITFLLNWGPTPSASHIASANERDAKAWYNSGVSALAEKDYDQAVTCLTTAIEMYGDLTYSAGDKLVTELGRRRRRISMPLVDSSIKESFHYREKWVQALTQRGNAYCKKGLFGEAITDYSIAIQLNRDTETYVRRAEAYRALGDESSAEIDERQAEFLSQQEKQASHRNRP